MIPDSFLRVLNLMDRMKTQPAVSPNQTDPVKTTATLREFDERYRMLFNLQEGPFFDTEGNLKLTRPVYAEHVVIPMMEVVSELARRVRREELRS